MSRFLEIFGAVHLAAYALIGFSMCFTLFVNWTARQFKLKADMLRIYNQMLKDRFDKKRGPAA